MAVSVVQQLQHPMLPTIRKGSQQLKFYEFRGSEDIPPAPGSGSGSRMPPKFSATQHSQGRGKASFLKKGSSFNMRSDDSSHQPNNVMSSANPVRYAQLPQSTLYRSTLSQQIKQIQRRIRKCERKIRQQKQKSLQDKETVSSRKEYEMIDLNRFDFLTNPGGKPAEEEEEEEVVEVEVEEPVVEPVVEQRRGDVIAESMEKLGLHYAKDLRKKFQRREMMPHKACRRKTPKLYITQQTNALEKAGKPQTQEQHLFRIMTRQTTPQQIYPTIPSFPVVRDNISKNVLAYLSDYKPFIEKTKEAIPILTKAQDVSDVSGIEVKVNQEVQKIEV